MFGKQTRLQPYDIGANMNAPNVASGGNATLTCTPATGYKVGVAWIDLGYRVAATGSIQISDGTTTWGPFTILLAGLQQIRFPNPLMFKKDGTVTITMIDGSQAKDLFAMFVQEAGDGGV